jgi:hypothetical protein
VMGLTAQCRGGGKHAVVLWLGGSGTQCGSYDQRRRGHWDTLEEVDEERAGRAGQLQSGGSNDNWAGKAIWAG